MHGPGMILGTLFPFMKRMDLEYCWPWTHATSCSSTFFPTKFYPRLLIYRNSYKIHPKLCLASLYLTQYCWILRGRRCCLLLLILRLTHQTKIMTYFPYCGLIIGFFPDLRVCQRTSQKPTSSLLDIGNNQLSNWARDMGLPRPKRTSFVGGCDIRRTNNEDWLDSPPSTFLFGEVIGLHMNDLISLLDLF